MKNAPLDYIERMWNSVKREISSTLAVNSNTKPYIDIGPLCIDLYRYLKTELYNNWSFRTTLSENYRDRYFDYSINSNFKP